MPYVTIAAFACLTYKRYKESNKKEISPAISQPVANTPAEEIADDHSNWGAPNLCQHDLGFQSLCCQASDIEQLLQSEPQSIKENEIAW